jgi:hypothetical protein
VSGAEGLPERQDPACMKHGRLNSGQNVPGSTPAPFSLAAAGQSRATNFAVTLDCRSMDRCISRVLLRPVLAAAYQLSCSVHLCQLSIGFAELLPSNMGPACAYLGIHPCLHTIGPEKGDEVERN